MSKFILQFHPRQMLFLLAALFVTLKGYSVTVNGLNYSLSPDFTAVAVTGLADKSITKLVIPESITYEGRTCPVIAIVYDAFSGCSSLTSVEIPNSVTTIYTNAFADCISLASIDIPNSVTKIEGQAFSGCRSLTSIKIPNSVTKIDYGTFRDCSSLTLVEIPNSVTTIDRNAFSGCSSLTSIEIPNSVTTIGVSAFSDCSSLTSINIPNSVTTIGGSAFSYCSRLTSIKIPESVTSIGSWAFWECYRLTKAEFASIEALCKISFYDSDANPLSHAKNLYIGGEEITALVIPNSVTKIGSFTFCNCEGLTSIEIPNSVTSIGESAFLGCSGLTSIEIPNSVTLIGESTFAECGGLTSIVIPSSVTSIGKNAFTYCRNIRVINYNTTKPIGSGRDIFDDNIYSSATLYVAEGGLEKAKTTSPWMFFDNIQEKDFSGIEDVVADFDSTLPIEVYNLRGVKVAESCESLSPGIYILKQGQAVKKVILQ